MAAIAADVTIGRGGNEVARPQVAHLRTELLDRAGHLVTEDGRQADAAPVGAVAHHDVVKADAAGGNRNPDLARAGLARADLGDAQDFGRAGSFGDDGAH